MAELVKPCVVCPRFGIRAGCLDKFKMSQGDSCDWLQRYLNSLQNSDWIVRMIIGELVREVDEYVNKGGEKNG